jgi:hypothetical protein
VAFYHPPITLWAFSRNIRYKLYFLRDTGNFLRYKSATSPLQVRYKSATTATSIQRKRHGSALNIHEMLSIVKEQTNHP